MKPPHRVTPAKLVTEPELRYYAHKLRPEDQKEISVASGLDVEEALINAIDVSEEAWVARHPDTWEPFIFFGYANDYHSGKMIWMVATDIPRDVVGSFLNASKKIIYNWRDKYYILHNLVLAENIIHIMWLEALGFLILKDKPVILNDEEFYYFGLYKTE